MKTARAVAHLVLGWKTGGGGCFGVGQHQVICDDATAAIEARDQLFTDALNAELTSIRRDLDEVKRLGGTLQARLALATGLLRGLEWSGKSVSRHATIAACPKCGALARDGNHRGDCTLGAFLATLGEKHDG